MAYFEDEMDYSFRSMGNRPFHDRSEVFLKNINHQGDLSPHSNCTMPSG
jgi:hypothetical protein